MKNFILVLGCIYAAACQVPTLVVKPVQIEKGSTTSLISKPSEIGYKVKLFKIPVTINEPKDALLKIDFKISGAGHCPMTYEPTEIFLNNKKLISFDFRKYFLETQINRTVKISKDKFIKGQNIFDIRSGACDFDIDVLNLNGLLLEI